MRKLKPVTPGGGRNTGIAHSGFLLSDDRQAIERIQNVPLLIPRVCISSIENEDRIIGARW
jgi:hypothetical protein